jgi:flagellar hook-associated protein 1 FlgK
MTRDQRESSTGLFRQVLSTSETGVSVDTELSNMIVLQNAYGANAKIISSAQTMFNTLLGAVNS